MLVQYFVRLDVKVWCATASVGFVHALARSVVSRLTKSHTGVGPTGSHHTFYGIHVVTVMRARESQE